MGSCARAGTLPASAMSTVSHDGAARQVLKAELPGEWDDRHDSRPVQRLMATCAAASRCHNRHQNQEPLTMHGPKSSLARAWYRLTTRRRLARNEWSAPYWEERNGQRIVACRRCPKFDAGRAKCSVPFGSPIRKCIVAAT